MIRRFDMGTQDAELPKAQIDLEELSAFVASDRLCIDSEDVLLQGLLNSGYMDCLSPKLWAAVRFTYLGELGCSLLLTDDNANQRQLPSETLSLVTQQLLRRTQIQASSVSTTEFGFWAAHSAFSLRAGTGGTGDAQYVPHPRPWYGFTLGSNGRRNDGRGCGIFFCWLDPQDPLGNNIIDLQSLRSRPRQRLVQATSASSDVGKLGPQQAATQIPLSGVDGIPDLVPSRPSHASHALPDKYAGNIAAWAQAYGQEPVVFNGAQMAAAVQEVSCQPHFRLTTPYHLPAHPGSRSSPVHKQHGVGTAATVPIASLWDLYQYFAVHDCWIYCVDIARLCILWLTGGGSAYVDTDMAAGSTLFPPQLTVPSGSSYADYCLFKQEEEQAKDIQARLKAAVEGTGKERERTGPAAATGERVVQLPVTPLLVLPQDQDGLLQNNFIATNIARHPFLTLALQAILVSAPLEAHVVHATGPALLTALYHVFKHCNVYAHTSIGAATLVPAVDKEYGQLRSSLPGASAAASATTASGSIDSQSDSARAWRSLTELKYTDTVHVLPPSAFYPSHWHGPGTQPPGTVDTSTDPSISQTASGVGVGSGPWLGPRSTSAQSSVGGYSGPTRTRDGHTGTVQLEAQALLADDPETAQYLAQAILERGPGGPVESFPAGQGSWSVKQPVRSTSAVAVLSLGVPVPPVRSSSWAGYSSAHEESSRMANSPAPAPAYGVHGWDTTWKGYPSAPGRGAGGYGPALSYGGYSSALWASGGGGAGPAAGPGFYSQTQGPAGAAALVVPAALAVAWPAMPALSIAALSLGPDPYGLVPLAKRVVSRLQASGLPGLPPRAVLLALAGDD